MSRKLIAVVTCDQRKYPAHNQGGHKDGEGRSDAIRATWYKTWLARYAGEIDLKFFFGRCERIPQENEIILDAGDDYYSLPDKVWKTYNWAYRAGYDEATKVDDDVFVFLDRLLGSPLTTDYRGYEIESDIKYASGTCYQLSRRALEMVTRASIPEGEWREDRHVGRVLLDKGIKLVHDQRFHCCHCEACKDSFPISKRITSHTASPEEMYALMETYQ